MNIPITEIIGRQPLSVSVYENIKAAIVNGDLKPGSRLTETKVGEHLNVSTTPVREAFSRLASEGLLKIVPYKGAVVQEFTEEKINEVYQCRESLEALSIELAVNYIDEAGINKLEYLVEKSKNTNDFTEYVEVNSSIHETILKYSNNKTLSDLLGQLHEVIYHNRNISSYSEQRRQEINNEHKEIIEAIKDRDKPRAMNAMKNHVRNGYEYIKNRI